MPCEAFSTYSGNGDRRVSRLKVSTVSCVIRSRREFRYTGQGMLVDDTPTIGTVTPDDFRRIREVFELALERPTHERRAFVERACQGNTLLVVEVERMLAAEDDHHQLLDRGPRARSEKPLAAPSICPSCQMRFEQAPRFCPSCGTPVGATAPEEGRFRAGALFANRFRIVGSLQRGGMGEVYRAHDLELGQPVALKFLHGVAIR